MAQLEHINITVADPKQTAEMLQTLFGWHIRWEGKVLGGKGYTIHVGTDSSYLAVFTGFSPDAEQPLATASYEVRGGLNHVGVTVDDLDAVEAKVKAMGFATHNHADYEPGRRFYFHDADGIEFEVVSYA